MAAPHDRPGYDIVIVGSGSAGSVLAARLSEDPDRQVLLLEGGPGYASVDELPRSIIDPADMSNSMPASPHNWGMYGRLTEGVEIPITRGKTVGGSSSVNGAYFVRGTKSDFAAWAAAGNDDWSYDKVLPFFTKLENDHDFDNELHGSSGPVPVRREPLSRAPVFTPAFTEACRSLGHPLDPDKNAGEDGGVGPVPMNVDGGRRMGTAITHLFPALHRRNLELVSGAQVTRVLLDDHQRCTGVEYVVSGRTYQVQADKTIISAGALRTPLILMASGIGPAEHLAEHGISTVVDLPGVGSNLTDHPELSARWTHGAKLPSSPGQGVITSALHWTSENATRPGDLEILPFVSTAGDLMKAGSMARRPWKALAAMRKTSVSFTLAQARSMRLPFMVIGLQDEDSRGTVRLRSADPSAAPVLDWNLMSEESDRARFREAVRMTAEIFATPSMQAVKGRLVNLTPADLATDKATDAWARANIFTVGHAAGTCKMGPDTDPMAVVDQSGRVRGITALRVVDTSIFPLIPTRGPNATTVMVGERIAHDIDAESASAGVSRSRTSDDTRMKGQL